MKLKDLIKDYGECDVVLYDIEGTKWLGEVIIRDCSDLALSKSKDIEVLPDVPGGNV